MVCTMLFSRMVEPPSCLSSEMASTAIGIDADTVKPGLERQVHRRGAEDDAEDHADDDGLGVNSAHRSFGGDVGLKLDVLRGCGG